VTGQVPELWLPNREVTDPRINLASVVQDYVTKPRDEHEDCRCRRCEIAMAIEEELS
jgi:hypothetical protein